VARPRWRVPDVRLAGVGVVLVAAWVGIGVRLVDVQALSADEYADRGLDQRVRQEELLAVRGSILDRAGRRLATTVDAVTVVADPTIITDDRAAARLLARLVEGNTSDLRAAFAGDSRYYVVARGIEGEDADEVRAAVEEAQLDGVFFETEPKRIYPAGALASQVVGFVGGDVGGGLEGLEHQYDDRLSGIAGSQIIERDPFGNPIPQGQYVVDPPLDGADLVLTIDAEIQFAAERALKRRLRTTKAEAGSIIVMDVTTGELLAVANAPTFDPNDRSGVDPALFRDRAVADVYEPGSTLKVVTVAAALEEGIVEPSTLFKVPAEYVIPLQPEPKVYTDEGRSRDVDMTVGEIVARSSNIGTILIQQLLGNEAHHRYLEAFGLGEKAGDLPGESAGSLEDAADWCDTTCGPSTAIGYRVGVTPLQMAGVFAAIANDGVWVEPHVVGKIVRADLSTEVVEPDERVVLSPETARIMQQLLRGVVEAHGGTGRLAAVAGYTVGGKTGTTEKYLPDEGAYSETERIASFIGIAPISDPRIVVVVVLDSPRGEDPNGGDYHFGGVSAAPVFAEVAEAALHDLGIPQDAS